VQGSKGFEELSPWLRHWPSQEPSLTGTVDTDVVVIGAGFTGLSAALELRAQSSEVVVLESQRSGFGASGRNAGHLTPTIGKDLTTLVRMHGRERVSALVGFSDTAVSYVEDLIAGHQIACDYEAVGNVITAVHPLQHAKIDRVAEAAFAFGIDGELLDKAAIEKRGLPPAFTRGYFEPHGGVLDPGKYLLGLRRAAVAAGARLCEGSAVETIDDHGSRVIVKTTRGRVRARAAVIATNAYSPQLKRLRRAGVRLQVQLFRTRPLTDKQFRDVGWRGREGIYTAHEVLESYRLTRDDCIVGGSKTVRVAYGDRVLPDVDSDCSRVLEKTFYDRFPELRSLPMDQHWGGAIFSSPDFLPAVGRTGRGGKLVYAVAFNGHGIAHASYAGRMVADLLAERDGPGRVLWGRRSWPLPPEPIRWLFVRGLLAALGRIDRRVDRIAHGRPRSARARSRARGAA